MGAARAASQPVCGAGWREAAGSERPLWRASADAGPVVVVSNTHRLRSLSTSSFPRDNVWPEPL